MARSSRRALLLAFLALFALLAITTKAQLTDLPDLSTISEGGDATPSTTESDSPSSTQDNNDEDETESASASTTSSEEEETESASASSTSSEEEEQPSTTENVASSTAANGGLTDAPTIAGAGIPSIGVPWTGGAPFMQRSSLPEGTVFIAVGAVLGLLGACVLLWRGMVAWSLNHSVKKAALASVGGKSLAGEKNGEGMRWPSRGTAPTYTPVTRQSTFYKDGAANGSSVSLDNLNSAGRNIKSPFRDNAYESINTPPPAGLFFSPTAAASNRDSYIGGGGVTPGGLGRNSSYGFNPSASNLNLRGPTPYDRHSPPQSPAFPPDRRASGTSAALRGSSQNRMSYARDSTTNLPATARTTGMRSHPSSASLPLAGQDFERDVPGRVPRGSGLAGTRAPSAYLDDLFDNHGNWGRDGPQH